MWIDARDEMPRRDVEVLVFWQDAMSCGMDVASANRDGTWKELDGLITHWQPLPSAPSERKPKPQTARTCGTCKNWERGECCLPRSPRFTDTTSATDGCTPNKKARADWI